MKRGPWLKVCIFLLAIAAMLFVVLHERQNVFDWRKLHGYQAPAAISNLATDDTMTPQTRRIFYVNHPGVEDKTTFTKSCPNNGGEKTVVLGCYHSNQQGIFLLNVTDARLNGVEQVTAAHELLHAAYDRLSSRERNYVNGLLMNYYQHDLHDPRLLSTIAEYKKTEPNDWVNEMHSVFGTEVASLPAPLETYYKRYFTDRQKIAAYAAQYEGAFASRQQKVAVDDAQLTTWKAQISSDEKALQTDQQDISAAQSHLVELRSSGQIDAYNAAVPAYNAQVDTYNALAQTVRDLIDNYNRLVAQRNSIALEENQLVQDITSAPAAISK